MSGTGDRIMCIASATVLASALAAGACLLPFDTFAVIVTALTGWTCASLPIGVLVGHCTFTGD